VSGNTVAGVPGTATAESHSACTADGDIGCVANLTYTAALTTGLAPKIVSGNTVAGVPGTAAAESHSNCTADGDTACVATATYKAALTTGLAAKVVSGQTVAGVPGSATAESHIDCAADGATACVATASYKAADITGLASKVLLGQTVAGTAGNVTLPAANVVYTGTTYGVGGNGSTGTLTIPAAAQVRSGAGAYGLGGNGTTPTLPDCASDGANGCVAVGPLMAAAVTTGLAAKVVTGQTVAGVDGSAIAEAHSDCSADGSTGCVATASYKAAATSGLAPKIVSGFTVAGVAGSAAAEAHINCAADGETACVATASYTAAATSGLAAKIVSGNTVAGVPGTTAAEGHSDCSADGATGCVATSSYTAAATSNLAPKIVSGNTVAGIAGSATAESHGNCSADGETGCISTVSYRAANVTGLASKVLFGQTVASTAGNVTLPAVGHVLSGMSFGISGTGSTGTLTLPTAANVRVSNGAYGASGTGVTPTLADCSANNVSGCVTTATYKSADFTNITAGNIKNGVVLAGVTGAYPSVTHPLAGATATADLTAATFDAKVKSSAGFEWFDSTGALQSGAGDTDIAAENISGAVTIFGTTGSIGTCTGDGQVSCLTTNTYKSVDTSAISAWDLRYGKSAGGLTGQIRTSCQNRITSTIYNQDGVVNNSGGVAGTSFDWWDTIDNWNNNAATLPQTNIAGFGAESVCDAATVWSDVTTDGSCNAAADDCVFYDRITQRYWSETFPTTGAAPAVTGSTWANAVARCNNLSFGGFTDWRLPTEHDLQTAAMHGFRDLWLSNSNFAPDADNYMFWSATTASADTTNAWSVFMTDGTSSTAGVKSGTITGFGGGLNYTNTVVCVRP
jgi:hypothetical protein